MKVFIKSARNQRIVVVDISPGSTLLNLKQEYLRKEMMNPDNLPVLTANGKSLGSANDYETLSSLGITEGKTMFCTGFYPGGF